MIELEGIVKSYNGRRVLTIERLTLERGQLNLIVGENGAGKSTLLRILALIETSDRGKVAIEGGRITLFNRHLWRRRIGWLMQTPLMLSGTALENVELGLRFRRWARRLRRERALWALREVGFQADPNKPARQLSGGQQKLVALARIFAFEPEILLLDEPFVHLDEERHRRLAALLKKEVARGRLVVVSEHQKNPSFQGARHITLEGGRIVEISGNAGAARRAALC